MVGEIVNMRIYGVQMSKGSRECPSRVWSRNLKESMQLPGESRCEDPEVQNGVSFQEQDDPGGGAGNVRGRELGNGSGM